MLPGTLTDSHDQEQQQPNPAVSLLGHRLRSTGAARTFVRAGGFIAGRGQRRRRRFPCPSRLRHQHINLNMRRWTPHQRPIRRRELESVLNFPPRIPSTNRPRKRCRLAGGDVQRQAALDGPGTLRTTLRPDVTTDSETPHHGGMAGTVGRLLARDTSRIPAAEVCGKPVFLPADSTTGSPALR